MKGVFTLDTPSDLLAKLQFDYDALCQDRNNPYIAFNFFVTAEHMLDWVYPGYKSKDKREEERKSEVLLQICSHLANGAKHFIAEAKHHTAVKDSGRMSGANPFYGPLGGPFVRKTGPSGLCVVLDGEARDRLGSPIRVSALADKVLEFWKRHRMIESAVT